MKYAITFAMMSAVLAVGAFVYPAAAILLIWAAISFGCVALAYAGFGARVFNKGSDGRIPWLIKFLLLPYLFYTWIIWHVYRLVSREDSYNCIDDDLVVGRRLLTSEVPDGFDHYVDLTAEFEDPAPIRSKHSYRSFPILDASIPSEEELKSAVESALDGRTYIHCAQGHGRTGLFALALLNHRGQIDSAKDGIELLKSLRPAINLNRKQSCFIERYLTQMQNKRLDDTPKGVSA